MFTLGAVAIGVGGMLVLVSRRRRSELAYGGVGGKEWAPRKPSVPIRDERLYGAWQGFVTMPVERVMSVEAPRGSTRQWT